MQAKPEPCGGEVEGGVQWRAGGIREAFLEEVVSRLRLRGGIGVGQVFGEGCPEEGTAC